MAVKQRRSAKKRVARRKAAKAAKTPRAPKARKARRATRKAARKAAKTPKAPKARRRAARRATKRAAKTPRASKQRRRASRKATKKAKKTVRKPRLKIGSMRRVFSGTADRTKGGLTKKDLVKNKRGKVVSKKALASGKRNFKKSPLSKWVAATKRAKAELGLTGFVLCKKGTPYYKLTRKYYD